MEKSLEQHIEEEIAKLPAEDNWDGEGSPAPKEEVIDRVRKAVPLMQKIVSDFVMELGAEPIFPSLGPYVAGSIDVYWNKPKDYTVLLNIPVEGKPKYYGDNHGDKKIKGELDVFD